MRFHKQFVRSVGKGGDSTPALGSDDIPIGEVDLTRDCAFQSVRCDINGFPIQRVVVGYTGPCDELVFDAYVFDEMSKLWFAVSATHAALKNGHLVGVDTPSLIEVAGIRSPVEIYLRVMCPSDAPDGLYRFVFGADVSNPGI